MYYVCLKLILTFKSLTKTIVMKKKVLFVASLFLATATFAQDGLTSKKGETILPESGDWAIGFDANPFLNFAGNILSGTATNNFGGANWTNGDMAITGKMFKDETTAYRAGVRIGLGGSSFTTQNDTSAGFGNPVYVEDVFKTSNGFNVVLSGGLEKRRGSTRIQGFYGGEVLIGMISGGTTDNEYGAVLDSANLMQGAATNNRVTETKGGNTLSLGLRGFIGAEWFVAPKVSIAAEYGWGFMLNSTGEVEITTEHWGLASAAATTDTNFSTTTMSSKSSSWGLDTDVSGTGSLRIMFHF